MTQIPLHSATRPVNWERKLLNFCYSLTCRPIPHIQRQNRTKKSESCRKAILRGAVGTGEPQPQPRTPFRPKPSQAKPFPSKVISLPPILPWSPVNQDQHAILFLFLLLSFIAHEPDPLWKMRSWYFQNAANLDFVVTLALCVSIAFSAIVTRIVMSWVLTD